MYEINIKTDSLQHFDLLTGVRELQTAVTYLRNMRSNVENLARRWKDSTGISLQEFKNLRLFETRTLYDKAVFTLELCNSSFSILGIKANLDCDEVLFECYKKIDKFNPKNKKTTIS